MRYSNKVINILYQQYYAITKAAQSLFPNLHTFKNIISNFLNIKLLHFFF